MQVNPARIVVVEDSLADVRLLRHALDQEGEPYVLDVILDGEEAIRFVEEHRRTIGTVDPCVIVLDLHLPKCDGMAVLRAIRRAPALRHIRVAVLTTLASPREEQELKSLGVQLYRRKPVDLNQFEAIAKEILALCKEESLTTAV